MSDRAKNPEYRAELERTKPFAELAWKVIRLRMDFHLTQEQLAERVGTTKSAVSRLESGQHAPNIATLEKIAAAFGGQLVIDFDIPGRRAGPTRAEYLAEVRRRIAEAGLEVSVVDEAVEAVRHPKLH